MWVLGRIGVFERVTVVWLCSYDSVCMCVCVYHGELLEVIKLCVPVFAFHLD